VKTMAGVFIDADSLLAAARWGYEPLRETGW
jgi:hypothetical protein